MYQASLEYMTFPKLLTPCIVPFYYVLSNTLHCPKWDILLCFGWHIVRNSTYIQDL